MTAIEARNIAKEYNLEKELNEILQKIYKDIEAAAYDGKYEIKYKKDSELLGKYSNIFLEKIENILKRDGFYVYIGSYDTKLSISW